MRYLNIIVLFLFLPLVFFSLKKESYAVYDPLSKPNNFYGIHILFPEEIKEASRLVNANGGEWGYVTIPIQAGDKDVVKWQKFFDEATEFKITPIIRLMTEPDLSDTSVWRVPSDYDLVDFANFLNSLSWPTKNRYIILFNEINRFDEWGGKHPEPIIYSELVVSAYQIFKERSLDFFLILGAFDNASVTDGENYINGFDYLRRMHSHVPEIFDYIDGFSSHSYPNPAFSQPPNSSRRVGVATYKYEYDFINSYAKSKKHAFITETGWDSDSISEENVASYYDTTFSQIWGEDSDKIVAITPFLMMSQNGQFDKFSFFKNGQPRKYYSAIQSLPKYKGEPILGRPVIERKDVLNLRTLADNAEKSIDPIEKDVHDNFFIKSYFKLLLHL